MCGIAGSINFPLPVEEVQHILYHRGPDEQTSWTEDGIQFIHARLAIQDLSPGGRQPMHLNGLHIAYNGEIYNHQEIRKKHQLKCTTQSDTETLLRLFEKLGTDMLTELDGMFAIALYDERTKDLFLIRDRAGEKPLYYRIRNQGLVFASELQVLKRVLNPEVNKQLLANFLAIGYLPVDETPYHDIQELPPGHFLQLNLKNFRRQLKKWWSIMPYYETRFEGSLEDAVSNMDLLLQQSVKRRLLSSDLEVGTFLSGGLDSGLVTAMATKTSEQIKTFTISFDGMFNEAPLARLVAGQLRTHHTEIPISINHLDQDIEKIFQNYGEPMMDDAIIPSYYVSQEAKKNLTVILNGDGGDELMGGYRRYVPFANFDLFKGRLSYFFKPIKSIFPVPKDKMSYYNYMYRLLSLLSSSGRETYWKATNDLMHDHLTYFSTKPNLEKYLNNGLYESLTPLQKVMCMDFENILPTTLLVKMDVATMAFALEGRSPFLSKEILEFVPSLPDEMKIKGKQTKYLIRKLAEKYLPKEILDQPKRGFEVPLQHWIDTCLSGIIGDLLLPSNTLISSILKPGFIKTLVENKSRDFYPDQRAKILFACLSIECWSRK